MVLNEICDDYENIDQIILPVVARECAKLLLSMAVAADAAERIIF